MKERANTAKTKTEEPKELVLPYIIERKRMDDLASSIKDGRFREQKFRLKQSGLSKPIYLVEEFGSQYASLPEGTCLQAVTNTQVVDGFTVKITKDQQESAAFLTIMTRCLQSRYRGRSVTSISIDELQSQPSESFNYEVETELVTFGELNRASMKNQQLSVKDMFAKHLLQLHGVSVEKAKAIVEKFGNPASLIAAYEELGDPAKCAQLLASLKYGKTGRQIGPTLSTHISKLYANVILK
ncbi:Crossover junction endonuclease mus81 [Halocaridina rubra]|uniref:Crossover junction endonuclease MUS81 n=1 Tax=Halocaridina rubra TaxID=373956 RepID=A0AAN9A682_HALRR